MAVVLKCPICRGKFKYDVNEGWPDECILCHADINNRVPDDVVTVPAFLSQKTKNNDKVARDIMNGSETRVELAAQMAGTSVEDMSSLKVTNLNDRNDAEFAAVTVKNEVTQRMDAMAAAGLQTGFGTNSTEAMQRAAASHTGEAPYAGLRAMKNLQSKMAPIGQAPLPLQITNNPNYRSPV